MQHVYCTALKGGPRVICREKVTATIVLHVRHGTTLALRSIEWLVSTSEVSHVIIGQLVLKVLGLDNQALLEAACDRNDGSVNVKELIEDMRAGDQNMQTGSVEMLMANVNAGFGATYHQDGDAGDEDDLQDSDVYVDLGEDSVEDLRSTLRDRVDEARRNGMTEEGSRKLEGLLQKYEQVFGSGWGNPHQLRLNL